MPFVDEALWWMEHGHRTVMMPKGDTSLKAFRKTWGLGGHYFYYQRVKFKGAKNGAEFPSILAFFGTLKAWEIKALEELGQGRYTSE